MTCSCTFNEHGKEMMDKLNEVLSEVLSAGHPPEAAKDLSLSRTHLEDALTRFNSAQYRIKGTWQRADPEKS